MCAEEQTKINTNLTNGSNQHEEKIKVKNKNENDGRSSSGKIQLHDPIFVDKTFFVP